MNFESLKKIVGIGANNKLSSKQVTLNRSDFDQDIQNLFDTCYDTSTLTINTASLKSLNDSAIIITGKSSVLNINNVPVEISLTIENQKCCLSLDYTMISGEAKPDSWTFEKSFPELPKVLDASEAISFDRESGKITTVNSTPLSDLKLKDSHIIVTNNPTSVADSDAQLSWGMNFVSEVLATGSLGFIEKVFKHKNSLTIYGLIRSPRPTDSTSSIKAKFLATPEMQQYPWEVINEFEDVLPGILLQIDLNIDYAMLDGKITFAAEKYYLYTPCNTDWEFSNTNPQFVPTTAYTGKICLGDQGVEMDVIAPLRPGVDELALISHFKNFSIENLAKVSSLTGDSNILEKLPSELQSSVKALEKLSLMNASVFIDATHPTSITLSYLAVEIGFPDVNWKIWKDDIVLSEISCQVQVFNPLSKANDINERETIITLHATVEIEQVKFSAYASNLDGFSFYLQMDSGESIPLKNILKKFGGDVSAPGDLSINTLRMMVAPGTEYSMALGLSSHPKPWTIPIGPVPLMVENVSMAVAYNSGNITGSVSGKALLGDITLELVYDIPGDILIRSMIPKTSLKAIASELSEKTLLIPKEFDLEFENSTVMMKKTGSNYVFQLVTEINELGYIGIQVEKFSGKWGIALGVDLLEGGASKLPGLSIIEKFTKTFTLEDLMLVASTNSVPGFQFPDASAVNNPLINSKSVTLPASTSGITEGLNVFAKWRISTEDKSQKLLKKLLGLDPTIDITLQVGAIPSEHSKLFVSLDSTLNGHPFKCAFGGLIDNGEIGLFLTGTITTKIQKTLQTFDVTTVFAENGILISGDMQGPKPLSFGAFEVEDLALEIGVSWEAIPSLGIAGTIVTKEFNSSIAIFLDSVNPAQSLIAGAVSDLTAKNVLDVFVGKKATPSAIDRVLSKVSVKGTHSFTIDHSLETKLDNLDFSDVAAAFHTKGGIEIPSDANQLHMIKSKSGDHWYLTDLSCMRHYELKKTSSGILVSIEAQFYFAPLDTSIGNVRFRKGFYVNGALDILGFKLTATVDIDTSKGVAIDATMSPISIGGGVIKVTAEKGGGGPRVSASNYSQPKHPVKAFRNPHFYINGAIDLLGLKDAIYVSLTTKGLEFDLKGSLIPGLTVDLNGEIGNPKHLSVGGKVKAGIGSIKIPGLGTLKINTDAEGDIKIEVRGNDVEASAGVEFEALGKRHKTGSIKLDVKERTLEKLPQLIKTEAEHIVQGAAKSILKDINNAQAKVKKLDGQINHMRATVKDEQARAIKRYKNAESKVDQAQHKVDSINSQIRKAKHQISSLNKSISNKKKWSNHGNVFQKASRKVQYAAYAAEKGTEIAGLETEIGTLTASIKTADAALTVAKQPLKGLAAATKVIPVDTDPRVASLITARATAYEALQIAKAPIKGIA